jgi:hypothetical protein
MANDGNLYNDEDEYGNGDSVSVTNNDKIEEALEGIRNILFDLANR